MNLPEKYLNSMKDMLKDDFDDYLESFNDKRLYGLRVNNLKISTEDFLKISPFKLTPIPWIENGFYYEETDKPAKHPYYYAGLYYIQEPSAMTPANVLPIDEGDVVFDMCAAPGGKSTELAAKLNGTGLLITNDISNSRTKALLKNVEVSGIYNLCVLNEDPAKISVKPLVNPSYGLISTSFISGQLSRRYLKGETIDVDDFADSKGWALLCVDGYPLGWGKSNGSQLKNKYLAGWRWM